MSGKWPDFGLISGDCHNRYSESRWTRGIQSVGQGPGHGILGPVAHMAVFPLRRIACPPPSVGLRRAYKVQSRPRSIEAVSRFQSADFFVLVAVAVAESLRPGKQRRKQSKLSYHRLSAASAPTSCLDLPWPCLGRPANQRGVPRFARRPPLDSSPALSISSKPEDRVQSLATSRRPVPGLGILSPSSSGGGLARGPIAQ